MRFARILVVLAFFLSSGVLHPSRASASGDQRPPNQASDPTPLLAYYYIWFDPGSWDRAKRDLPLLGRYSSDNPDVMRQHIDWAKSAGIEGFIVSWKSTEQLNRRLATLVEVAQEQDFQLSIIYQGLDFERDPLPVDQIQSDIESFLQLYGEHPVFQMFGRPLVIWSGTWEFSAEDIERVSSQRSDSFYLLASERQIEEYEAIAELVDGNAYYWSSGDPLETGGYQAKLEEMADAVHRYDGLWIAPAAPGFDARLLGGHRVIDRRGGDTLRAGLNAARQASPDAIGLISWNEFSENTHIEPSRDYQGQALVVLADMRGGQVPPLPDFNSDQPSDTLPAPNLARVAPIALIGLILAGSTLAIIFRRSG